MADDQPEYLAQNGEPLTAEQRNAWFRERTADAREDGAKIVRISIHEQEPHLLLVEGWKSMTAKMGEQNWQFAA